MKGSTSLGKKPENITTKLNLKNTPTNPITLSIKDPKKKLFNEIGRKTVSKSNLLN
jgi:hypothetical protein